MRLNSSEEIGKIRRVDFDSCRLGIQQPDSGIAGCLLDETKIKLTLIALLLTNQESTRENSRSGSVAGHHLDSVLRLYVVGDRG